MRGGERVVGDDDGEPRAVDQSLDERPLRRDHGVHVGSAVQVDEGSARTQAARGRHAGDTSLAAFREAGAHRSGHRRVLRRGLGHGARRFLAVQYRGHQPHDGMGKTHPEGHRASFVSTHQCACPRGCTRAATRSRIRCDPARAVFFSTHGGAALPVVVGARGPRRECVRLGLSRRLRPARGRRVRGDPPG